MERPNWKMILPLAAVTGFVLTGFWGLLLGPIAAVPLVSWQRRRDGAGSADDEARRLAEFMAETLAASARKKQSPKEATKSEATKSTFEETRARLGQMDEAAQFEAFAAARLALLENGRDAQAAASMALLASRLAPGDALAALRRRSAVQAITLCLASGQVSAAAAIFVEYLDERASLRLAPAQLDALGRALLGQNNFMASAWALHAGALLARDAAGAQKRLIEVAGRAGAGGQPEAALQLYRTLLAKYPDSPYAQFARENMKLEEKRLVTARDTSGRG